MPVPGFYFSNRRPDRPPPAAPGAPPAPPSAHWESFRAGRLGSDAVWFPWTWGDRRRGPILIDEWVRPRDLAEFQAALGPNAASLLLVVEAAGGGDAARARAAVARLNERFTGERARGRGAGGGRGSGQGQG